MDQFRPDLNVPDSLHGPCVDRHDQFLNQDYADGNYDSHRKEGTGNLDQAETTGPHGGDLARSGKAPMVMNAAMSIASGVTRVKMSGNELMK